MEKSHIEVGALHCFPLKIYGFCSSNALYLESLQSISTRMFDTFDNWDHYYFESNLSLELLIKVFLYKKHVTNVLSYSSKKKERNLPHEIIFVFIWYFIGAISSNNSHQKRRVQKRDKNEGWSYSGGGGRVPSKELKRHSLPLLITLSDQ